MTQKNKNVKGLKRYYKDPYFILGLIGMILIAVAYLLVWELFIWH